MDTPNPKTADSVSSGQVASNNEPLVSVLIPCYNAERYIGETLDSVIAQTYPHWECIVVDDHSTDNSAEIVQSYCRKYPDKIFLYTNPRKGACAARNVAFEKSKGEFLQYLDADDLISENKFEEQIRVLKNKTTHLAICNTCHFSAKKDNSNCIDKSYVFSSDTPADFLINLWGGYDLPPHYVAVHSWLTPRKIVGDAGQWNELVHKDQDGEFFTRVILKSNGIIYTPKAKSYYRKYLFSNNISSQKKRKHIESNLMVTQLKEKYLLKIDQSKNARRAIATQYKHVAIEAWPQFKDIYRVAYRNCKQHGGSDYSPVLGGQLIELIKKIFGWKIAKSISWYGHKNRFLRNMFSKVKQSIV